MRFLAPLLALLPVLAAAQSSGVLSPEEIQQLELKLAQNPGDRAAQTALGRNYAFAILGITALGQFDRVTGMDPARPHGPHARAVLQSTANAGLLAESGKALWSFVTFAQARSRAQLTEERTLASTMLDRAIALDPDTPAWRSYRVPITVLRSNFGQILPLSAADAYVVVKDDVGRLTGFLRIYSLADAAKLAVRAAALDDAEAYAREMLTNSVKDWNEGNALYFGNMVLGQVALRRSETPTAIGYLLASGRSPGSPQLDSFGPNMTLAKDLLETKTDVARHAVVEFFDLCAVFWKLDRGQLKRWGDVVRNGGIPDFGANLLY